MLPTHSSSDRTRSLAWTRPPAQADAKARQEQSMGLYDGLMAVDISDDAFDEAVSDALDQIPGQFLEALDNVVILVEDEPEGDDKTLLGLYEGTPLSDRDSLYGGVLPDRILIYRGSLKRMCADVEELVEEIGVTVVHEIAHYFGIEDDDLDELGWG